MYPWTSRHGIIILKKFKDKEYYNKLNSVFKIPTYYGIEFKANIEDNSGLFLNPEN